VEGAIRVPVAQVAEPGDDAELGLVPLRSALGPQAPARVAREGNHVSGLELAPRGVQVAANHPGPWRGHVEAGPYALKRPRLGPADGRVGNVQATLRAGSPVEPERFRGRDRLNRRRGP
jgi:hypothetical protein